MEEVLDFYYVTHTFFITKYVIITNSLSHLSLIQKMLKQKVKGKV